jgi:beta-fructofuranosidase
MLVVKLSSILLALAAPVVAGATLVSHFPMEVKNGAITESVSGSSFNVNDALAAESADGAEGTALRLDGYSTFVQSSINTSELSGKTMVMSLWCAVESYPMMDNTQAVNTSTYIAGNMSDTNKSGFALTLSSQGNYEFDCYIDGWKVACKATTKLPKYEWNKLTAVVDLNAKYIKLYRNGEEVASKTVSLNTIKAGDNTFMIGKSLDDVKVGPMYLNTFDGIIDDISIYNSLDGITYSQPEHAIDFSVPASRFANDIQRPAFHGMPAAGWTNETHGLTYYDGKYHLFFQKNPNGPYWGRLQWGHLTSTNLYDWTEEKVAIAPSEDYDIKGCWSGCVYTDPTLTGGKPYLYYTAVDNTKATIAEATPVDDDLTEWTKYSSNPILSSVPAGMSADFRDCYIFTNQGEYYMIVGCSKDNIGAATLHKYNATTKTWGNDGSIFFQGKNALTAGTYWEMPVIVPMNNGLWLFVVTPIGSQHGTEALYWVGNIGTDGTFTPLADYADSPKEFELGTMSHDGYGLLSPSFCLIEDGRYLVMGIVPDKLATEENYKLGWAHTYSLPRELTLDANNQIIQKPYSGLSAMHTSTTYSASNISLDGTQSLSPVSGRAIEAHAIFAVGSQQKAGFRFFKNGEKSVEVSYAPATNILTVDASSVDRIHNDDGVFDGIYQSVLPSSVSNLDMHVYIDHSIMDIFINKTWATSIRLFPTDTTANGVEAFSEGSTTFTTLEAWNLDKSSASGIQAASKNVPHIYLENGLIKYSDISSDAIATIYSVDGKLIKQDYIDKLVTSLIPIRNGILKVKDKDNNFSMKFSVK